MKKKLMLDELLVETFEVDPEGLGSRGTVRAFDTPTALETECCDETPPATHCAAATCVSHCPSRCNSDPCQTCVTCETCPTDCWTDCGTCPPC